MPEFNDKFETFSTTEITQDLPAQIDSIPESSKTAESLTVLSESLNQILGMPVRNPEGSKDIDLNTHIKSELSFWYSFMQTIAEVLISKGNQIIIIDKINFIPDARETLEGIRMAKLYLKYTNEQTLSGNYWTSIFIFKKFCETNSINFSFTQSKSAYQADFPFNEITRDTKDMVRKRLEIASKKPIQRIRKLTNKLFGDPRIELNDDEEYLDYAIWLLNEVYSNLIYINYNLQSQLTPPPIAPKDNNEIKYIAQVQARHFSKLLFFKLSQEKYDYQFVLDFNELVSLLSERYYRGRKNNTYISTTLQIPPPKTIPLLDISPEEIDAIKEAIRRSQDLIHITQLNPKRPDTPLQ